MIPVLLTDTATPDPERALYYTMLWGLEGVMLRMVEKGRVPYINLPRLRHHLDDAEMPVMAISPGLFEGAVFETQNWMNDLFLLDEAINFAKKMNCSHIEVSGFTAPAVASDRVRALEKAKGIFQKAADKAAKAQIKLAVINEAGGLFERAEQLVDFLTQVAHPNLRAAWDPRTALLLDEDVVSNAEYLAKWVDVVHLRDGKPTALGWEDAVLGKGHLNVAEILGVLHRAGYNGLLVQEVYTEPKGKTGLHSATALIHLIRSVKAGL